MLYRSIKVLFHLIGGEWSLCVPVIETAQFTKPSFLFIYIIEYEPP